MTESEHNEAPDTDASTDHSESEAPLDPKEAMRQALERKRAGEHGGPSGVHADRGQGHAQGKVGGKREFRRKSGG